MIKIKTTLEISRLDFESLICSVVEGGYSPWLHDLELVKAPPGVTKEAGRCWYDQPDDRMFAEGMVIKAVYDDPDNGEEGNGEGQKNIGWEAFIHGFQVMAKKYPNNFADIISGNADANTGDVYIQCVLFGEAIYA